MTPEQLQELLTHVLKTYGATAMMSLRVAFDTSCPDAALEYGSRAVDYYNVTSVSLEYLDM